MFTLCLYIYVQEEEYTLQKYSDSWSVIYKVCGGVLLCFLCSLKL
jgi:hypothetical protein